MATTLTYTVFSLGEAQLHQLHTISGKVGHIPRGYAHEQRRRQHDLIILQLIQQSAFIAISKHVSSAISAAVCDGRGGSGVVPREPHGIPAGKHRQLHAPQPVY